MKTLFLLLLIPSGALAVGARSAEPRPNLIWIVLDDAGPDLGAYGDPYARTPNLDRLAREGMRFTRAFAHAPVCAPSRAGLITGLYPTTTGAHHMRSQLLAHPEAFTSLLRRAGYHVVWPGKTDFNLAVPEKANPVTYAPANFFDSREDWTRRIPRERPFFAYLNLGITHEGQVRLDAKRFAEVTARLKPADRHDPARVTVPPYYPDAPEVRRDLAHYYDLLTVADYQVGDILAELDRQGLSEHTVVMVFSDHGRGMPRAKRWLYDSGIRVPLIVRWPGRLRPGSVNQNMVSLIDFAPTMLRLAGAEVPARMQGQFFLDPRRKSGLAERKRRYVFAARDRMDEAYDRIRAVRDERFKYLRNYHPELPYAQRIAYNEENPTMRVWRRLHEEGKLDGAARLFFAERKPTEELYDTRTDPFEVRNLTADPQYGAVLSRMRRALDDWIRSTRDMGEIPEEEMVRRGIVRDVREQYRRRER